MVRLYPSSPFVGVFEEEMRRGVVGVVVGVSGVLEISKDLRMARAYRGMTRGI